MGRQSQGGFTIIETTLFLAISGLLILMIVAGTGASLNIQRYRDSVESFKSLVQQQYSNLANVQNGRTPEWSCDSTSTVTNEADGELRGQSECFLVGKYMRIDNTDISIYTVLASRPTTNQTEDVLAMEQDFAMNVGSEVEERKLDWGSRIAWAHEASAVDGADDRTPRTLGILFIRSPQSGQVYTFTSNSIPEKDEITQATFTDLIAAGNVIPGQAGRMVCIASGGLFASGDMGVSIAPFASTANAIKVHVNEDSTPVDGGTSC